MSTQKEQADTLVLVLAQQVKTGNEIGTLITKVTELEAVIAAGGDATPELIAAVAAVKAQAQVLDDLVPDQPNT